MKTQTERETHTASKVEAIFKCSVILFVLALVVCVIDSQGLKQEVTRLFPF